MAKVIIVAEKPSAARAFDTALGGRAGKLSDGRSYQIVNLRGHLFDHKPPADQPAPGSAQSAAKLGGRGIGEWVADVAKHPDRLPWDHRVFQWARRAHSDAANEIAQLRRAVGASDVVEIMCATDVDPSGEGGLLFEEAATELGWVDKTGHPSTPGVIITRAKFLDEAPVSLRRAVDNAGSNVIASRAVSLYDWDEYRKASARSRLDFLSQQYVQISTVACGNHSVLRQGRLKSAMLVLIADQQAAHDGYVKTTSYVDQLIDENDVVYKHPDQDRRQRPSQTDAVLAGRLATLQSGEPWPVRVISRQTKRSAPPRLLDLSTLAGKLSHLATSDQVLAVYQKMYEAQVVSYPRTEDKHVTHEQFRALLADADEIADVIGVKTGLLTHTAARPTHIKNTGAHGANRPGPKVPSSLGAVRQQFGDLGAAIYDLVARSALAMLAEDYVYTAVSAEAGPAAPDGPYTTQVNIAPPANSPDWGWKRILGVDKKADTTVEPGREAKARVGEIVPARPPVPTLAWLMKQLAKRDIGTGSTRVSTLSAVAKPHGERSPALVKDTRGKLTLTDAGAKAAMVIKGTALGDLDLTKKIQDQLAHLAQGDPSFTQEMFLDQMADWVRADAPKILAAAKNAGLDAPPDRHYGTWIDPATGQAREVSFPKTVFGVTIADRQAGRLLAGETLVFSDAKGASGNTYTVKVKLDHRSYNGRSFVGLKVVERGSGLDEKGNVIPFQQRDTANQIKGVWRGRQVSVNPVKCGLDLSDDATCQQAASMGAAELARRLLAGERVLVRGLAKKDGGMFDANVEIAHCEYNGRKYIGLDLVFAGRASQQSRQSQPSRQGRQRKAA
jgi:DNA topoisomerase-3